MKGVSAIIAIILILMIVVALAALAYTWFTGIFASLTGGAQSSVESTTQAMGTSFRIETVKNQTSYVGVACFNVSVTVRNVGTSALYVNRMSVYISDEKMNNITGASSTAIPYGNTTTFYVSNTTANPTSFGCNAKDKKLKLVAETGLEQTATIT